MALDAFPFIIAGGSAVALGLSLLLLREGLRGSGLPGCGAGSGCGAVSSSRWARIGPVPVAVLGALVYLAMLAAWVRLALGPAPVWVLEVEMVCGLLAIGAAGWFTGLQALVLGRWCLYCTILHAVGAIAGAASLAVGLAGDQRLVHPAALFLVGAVGLALLVLGQVLWPGRTYTLTRPPAVGDGSAPGVVASGTSPDQLFSGQSAQSGPAATVPPPTAVPSGPDGRGLVDRRVSLAGGRVTLNLSDWPLLGSPQATQVLASLFNYNCDDCRKTHGLLAQVLDQYAGQVALAHIPVPLHPACNPTVAKLDRDHAEDCGLTRLALALFLADGQAFARFDRWMFQQPRPPSLDLATSLAQKLVGQERLQEALADPRVETRLNMALDVYRAAGAGNLPRLLLPVGVLSGQVPSAQALVDIFNRELRLDASPATF